MNLLEPNEIKEDKKINVVQAQKRNISLANEEAKINAKLNLTKQNADKKKQEIREDVDKFVEEQRVRADLLIKEVEMLEVRKTDALKPVEDLTKEWEEKIEAVKEVLRETNANLAKSEQIKEDNLDMADKLTDRKQDLDLREEKIANRENGLTAEENRLKTSSDALKDNWVKFHEATNKANAEIALKETGIKDRETVIDIRGEEQDKREIEQNNHDRLIKDRYETLERAIKESKEKYNI